MPKTFECDKAKVDRVVLQKDGNDWVLIINYTVGISGEEPDSFEPIKAYSKCFTLTASAQTTIKSLLTGKLNKIKTDEGVDEVIY